MFLNYCEVRWTEIELNTYEQEEKRERDAQAILDQQLLEVEAAKTKYIDQGIEKGAKITAIALIQMNLLSDEQIATATKLPLEKIIALRL